MQTKGYLDGQHYYSMFNSDGIQFVVCSSKVLLFIRSLCSSSFDSPSSRLITMQLHPTNRHLCDL